MSKPWKNSVSPSGVCVLVSGGLDSALLLKRALDLAYPTYPLHIASGFHWENGERYWLEKQIEYLKTPQLHPLTILEYPLKNFFGDHWAFHPSQIPNHKAPPPSVYIPARNLMLLTQAALYCYSKNISEIWLGSLKGFEFEDRKPAFFKEMEVILEDSMGRKIKIETPFIKMEKAELISRYPDFPYELTFSCLNPKGNQHCQKCQKCQERQIGFQEHATL